MVPCVTVMMVPPLMRTSRAAGAGEGGAAAGTAAIEPPCARAAAAKNKKRREAGMRGMESLQRREGCKLKMKIEDLYRAAERLRRCSLAGGVIPDAASFAVSGICRDPARRYSGGMGAR